MIPLFSSSQVREIDSIAIKKMGVPGLVLMENASISIFNHIIDKIPFLTNDSSIGIICGKGNNGGDGFAVARHFANEGFNLRILFLADEKQLSGDALINFISIKNHSKLYSNIELKKFSSIKDINFVKDCDLVIDALLGTGTKGDIKEPYKLIITELNKLEGIKVSIDVPSGLNPDTGYGETVFHADFTITLGEYKKGLFFGKGAVSAGKVVKGYIGIPFSLFDEFDVNEYLIEPEDALYSLPSKKKDMHKYSSGKVLTIAGSKEYYGAPILTANSVLRSGSGASLLALPESIKQASFNSIEIVVQTYDDSNEGYFSSKNIDELKDRFSWMDVLAIGPGLGRNKNSIEAVLETIKLNKNKNIVIDADALFALGNGRYKKIDLHNKVLTPHLKEFAQLTGNHIEKIENNILLYGSRFVKETGAYLVLKGAPTMIFLPGGEVVINTTGNPGMAKFGSGDVLTGVIASFIAQTKNVEEGIIAGVYIHSLAADLLQKELTEFGFTATDIMNNISVAIKFLRDTFAEIS